MALRNKFTVFTAPFQKVILYLHTFLSQIIEWRNCKNTNILGYQPVNHTGGFKSVHFLRRNNNSFNSLFF